MIEWIMNSITIISERLRTHPLAVGVLTFVTLAYGMMLTMGAPGLFGINIIEWWAIWPNPVVATILTIGLYLVSVAFTAAVIASEVLVFSFVAGAINSLLTHRAAKLLILVMLTALGGYLYMQATEFLDEILTYGLSVFDLEPNTRLLAQGVGLLNIMVVIAAVFVPLPGHMVEDLWSYKLASELLGARVTQAKLLMAAETQAQIKFIEAGQTAPSGLFNMGGLLKGPLIGLNRGPKYAQPSQGQLRELLERYPDLEPFKRDLLLGPGGQLVIPIDEHGYTPRGNHRVGAEVRPGDERVLPARAESEGDQANVG